MERLVRNGCGDLVDGSSPNTIPPQDPYIGKEIDKYIILEPLGKGGMGVVYKAKHKNIKRLAALKLLSGAQAKDEVSVKRLEREASSMGNLQHQNIATMYDFGITQDAQAYIVLELIEGHSLHEIFKKTRSIEPEKLLKYLIQIADAMAYAHKKGLIHRDLKPGNIMITDEEDKVKILDFGIARSTEESMMLTKTGQIIGSAAYMSPEQCTGKKKVDTRTDIYALGVIMYQLITGSLPFKGETFLQTIFLKTTEHPEPFPETAKELKALEKLTLKCLMANPEDRPETMQVIKEELEEIAVLTNPHLYSTNSVRIPTREITVSELTGSSTIENTTPSKFNKEELDAIASNTTQVVNKATTEKETSIDNTNTSILEQASSSKFKNLALPVGILAALIFGLVSWLNTQKGPVSNQEAKVTPQTKPSLTNEKPTPVLPTGAAKTDSLMNSPKPSTTLNVERKKNSVIRPKPNRVKQLPSKQAPITAPPIVQHKPVVKPAPPARRSSSRQVKTNQSAKNEIIKSIKHNTRKGKELIKKIKKIF